MKLKMKIIVTLLMCINIYAGGFDDLGKNARVVSMGGAFMAVGNAPYALFYNPAGIYDVKTISLSTSYSNLYPGITDDNLNYYALSGTLPAGVIGNFGIGGVMLNTGLWQENIVYGTYSREIYNSFAVGGSIKLLRWSADAAPGETALSYFGFTFDAGISYTLSEIFAGSDLKVAAVVKNLTEPDISSGGKGAILPMELGGGIAYQSHVYNYIIALDLVHSEEILHIRTGAEFTGFQDRVFGTDTQFLVRAGYNGIISDSPFKQNGLNGGFGLVVNKLSIDYAYVFPLHVEVVGGSHKFSLSYSL
jgi:hypothetical protein